MALSVQSRGPEAIQAKYRFSIQRVLKDVRNTGTGSILLKYVEEDPHQVIITPYLRPNRKNTAFARPNSRTSAGTFSRNRKASGTGVRIAFSVDRLDMDHRPSGKPDEVMVHELAHSLRMITGTVRFTRSDDGSRHAKPMAGFETIEEFFAIMVADVYTSEMGRSLRGNHGRWTLTNTAVLNKNPYSNRLKEIIEKMPQFTRELAGIPKGTAPFNPFRDILFGEPIS